MNKQHTLSLCLHLVLTMFSFGKRFWFFFCKQMMCPRRSFCCNNRRYFLLSEKLSFSENFHLFTWIFGAIYSILLLMNFMLPLWIWLVSTKYMTEWANFIILYWKCVFEIPLCFISSEKYNQIRSNTILGIPY